MTTEPLASGSKKKLAIIGGVFALLIMIGGVFLFWYLNQPVPDEVSLESAVAEVSDSLPPAGATTDTTEPGVGLDGTWSVDTTVGDFSFEEATSSFVGFRIDEELASIGATTAVGRTPEVSGTLALEGAVITDVSIDADLSQIVTNASRRNSAVQRALDTNSFPVATFTLKEPIDIGAVPAEGEPVPVSAIGDLEIKGVTLPIEIPLDTQLVGDLIVVVGALDITFADWGVEMPTSPGVVSVEDHGILEIQLFFSRG